MFCSLCRSLDLSCKLVVICPITYMIMHTYGHYFISKNFNQSNIPTWNLNIPGIIFIVIDFFFFFMNIEHSGLNYNRILAWDKNMRVFDRQ